MESVIIHVNHETEAIREIEKYCNEKGYSLFCFKAGLTVRIHDIQLLANKFDTSFSEMEDQIMNLDLKVPLQVPLIEQTPITLRTQDISFPEKVEREYFYFDKPQTKKQHKEKKQRYRNFSRKHNY